jgi:hypothetical protein
MVRASDPHPPVSLVRSQYCPLVKMQVRPRIPGAFLMPCQSCASSVLARLKYKCRIREPYALWHHFVITACVTFTILTVMLRLLTV